MIGINPTPELRNYSHIITKHIKAIIIKPNLKTQNTKTYNRNRLLSPIFESKHFPSSRKYSAATNYEKP